MEFRNRHFWTGQNAIRGKAEAKHGPEDIGQTKAQRLPEIGFALLAGCSLQTALPWGTGIQELRC
jgi:hypothetical protein